MGVQHFESLLKEDNNLHLPEILEIAEKYPSDISVEENNDLMIPITIEENQSILSVSKNDKSPGPDGLPVEVYRALFDVLGSDLLRFIEDSRISGKIPAIFNSTFIALIPKTDSPKSFDDFRPISLCNFIYSIIGKTIYTCIKKILGRIISKEQFVFLPRR